MADQYHLSTLARDIAPYLKELLGTAASSVTSTGSSAAGAHDIGGPLHTGTLRNDQAPQFVLLDGSRPLKSNWSFRANVTVDGMDPSDHIARTSGEDWTHHEVAVGTAPITVSSSQNVAIALGETMVTVDSKLELRQPGSVSAVTGNTLSSAQGSGRHTHAVTATPYGDQIGNTLLKNDSTGQLFINHLYVKNVYSRTGLDITLRPSNWLWLYPVENQIIIGPTALMRTINFQSGFEKPGWAIDYDGNADLTHILADTLEVQAFIADVERVLAGAQRVTKSMGLLAQDFRVGYDLQIHIEDLPGFEGFENFEPGDYIRLRVMDRGGGGLIVGDAWYVVSGYHDNEDGTQRWNVSFAYVTPGATGLYAKKGLLVLDYGHYGQSTGGTNPGYWHVTTIEPYSPYAEVVTWGYPPWDYSNNTVRVRLGLLTGVTGNADEWGFWVYGGSASKFAVMSDEQFALHGITASWYIVNTEVMRIDPSADGNGNPAIRMTNSGNSLPTFTTGTGLWFGTELGVAKFRLGTPTGNRIVWNGSQLIVRGQILLEDGTVVGDDASGTGIVVAGAWQSGQNYTINRSMVSYGGGSYIATATHTSAPSGNEGPPGVGQYWALVAAPGSDNQDFAYLYEDHSDIPANFSGLFMSAQRMGYMYIGAWRTYMDNSGNFWLGGTSGNYISFNQTAGEFAGYYQNNKQWYARNADGSFRWAGGDGLLDEEGLHMQQDSSDDYNPARSVNWWHNIESRSGTPGASVRSYRTDEGYSKISTEAFSPTGESAVASMRASRSGQEVEFFVWAASNGARSAFLNSGLFFADIDNMHIGHGTATSASTLKVEQVFDSQTVLVLDVRGTASGYAMNVTRGGINRFQVRPLNNTNDIYVYDANLGNNRRGSVVWVGANTNPSGSAGYGPGHLAMKTSANAWRYLFIDSSGTLRIYSSDATGGTGSATRNANSVGTVVGLQTSIAEEKILSDERPRTQDAIERLQKAARSALRAFRYKDGRYNGEYFPNGLVIDYAPHYGLDRNDAYPQGRVRNDIVLSADLIAAIDNILKRLEELEN